jgi:hypothetical protein
VSGRLRAGLRGLDQRWVPRAAHRLRRLGGRAGGLRPVAAVSRSVSETVRAQPALAGSIVVVFIASLLLGAFGTGPDNSRTRSAPVVLPTTPPAALATIGPSPGTSVAVYLTRASVDLRHYGEIAANRSTYAVIDFGRYLTPDRALAVVGDVDVARAYVRVPSKLPTMPRSVPLTTGSELDTGILTAATVARATATSYAALLKALHPKTRADRLVKRRYAVEHAAAAVETRHLSHPSTCACVFAFVVHAGARQLGALARSPAVRVVDPAPPVVSLSGLTVLPLQPEYTSVVPRTGLPSG